MILPAVFAVLLAALVAYVAWSTWRRHRAPAELRDDWWLQFERDFRAYADRVGRRAENARRASRGARRPRRYT